MKALLALAAIALPHPHVAESTSYCLNGLMSDGTKTRKRSVAMNNLPLGSIIHLRKPGPGGLRIWHVRDHIGRGSQMDLWQSTCAAARAYGRRTVYYRVVRYGH